MTNESSIIIYTTEDGNTSLQVNMSNDTVWLSRHQMVELFGRDVKTISKHINNALKEELEGLSVVAKFATPKKYGRREGYSQTVEVEYYNLEMVTSVGYRVKSKRGIQFRQWANKVLKEYLIKGYAINKDIKEERYDELKEVVRLMSRAISLQEKVTESEYSGLFNVITDYVYALDTLDKYDYQTLSINSRVIKQFC